jgi:hypothetical protein
MHAGGNPNVFVYRFDWHDEPTVLGADLSVILGAASTCSTRIRGEGERASVVLSVVLRDRCRPV